jgi:hypothetical protein
MVTDAKYSCLAKLAETPMPVYLQAAPSLWLVSAQVQAFAEMVVPATPSSSA